MKTKRWAILIASIFVSMAILSKAHAVVPPPDGCYPNFTTAEGCESLNFLTTGAGNTGVGWRSLFSNGSGSFNTGIGGGALALNNGDSNTAVGAATLLLNASGVNNTAIGTDAMVYSDTGNDNTAVGGSALFHNTTGNENTVVGKDALFNNNGGNGNTAMGGRALANNTTGANNVALGVLAGIGVTTANNVICIGTSLPGENVSNSCYIKNIFGTTSAGATNVVINSTGKLGTVVSSRRFKEKIKPMAQASEVLFALEPVTFRYKNEIDPAGTSQFGLVAEEVEKVNPDLIVRDKEGKPYSVRYDQVNAMLLNEFLKEHLKVEEQRAAIAELKSVVAEQQKQFEEAMAEQRAQFEARLKDQDARIQKVSARLELNNLKTLTASEQ